MKLNSGDKSNQVQGLLILDIPVPHRGYLELLRKHTAGDVKTLFLVGSSLRKSLNLPEEIRANDPQVTKQMLESLNFPFEIRILELNQIDEIANETIFTSRDKTSEKLRELYFPNAQVTEESVFLRWDEGNVTKENPVGIRDQTNEEVHVQLMKRAIQLADQSSDWWRQVGVVIAKDGEVLVDAYNQALPSDHKPYIDGNPRDHIKAGTLAFLVSTVHAEQSAIAKAAKKGGVGLEGADLYLNSFPCPPCATSMGVAGIKRCFFTGTNSYLDAVEVLKAVNVEMIYVKLD